MEQTSQRKRKTTASFQLTTFLIPPAGDALVLGKESAIGTAAASKMLECAAPDLFETIRTDDETVEAIFVRKDLLCRVEREALVGALLEEARSVMSPRCMISVKVDITIQVTRSL